MSKLVNCPACGGFVPPSANSCPHCDGAVSSTASRWRAPLQVAAGGALAMTLMACYGAPGAYGPPPEEPQTSCEDSEAEGQEQCTEDPEGLTMVDPEASSDDSETDTVPMAGDSEPAGDVEEAQPDS